MASRKGLGEKLASYGHGRFEAPAAPTTSDWANLREAQRRAVLNAPHAALAVTIDVGDPRQLHPPDKQSVGLRLARAARHLIYGEAVTASGPVPRSATREGAKVIVSFDGVEDSLVAYSSNRPMAFELCAAEQNTCRFIDASHRLNPTAWYWTRMDLEMPCACVFAGVMRRSAICTTSPGCPPVRLRSRFKNKRKCWIACVIS